jgi:hypothetical protein
MTSEAKEGERGGGAEQPGRLGYGLGRAASKAAAQGTVSGGLTTDYPDGHGFGVRVNPCHPRHPWSEEHGERDSKDERDRRDGG